MNKEKGTLVVEAATNVTKDGMKAVREIADVTHCNGCQCMTKTLYKGRAHGVCGKCGHDKTLGDVFQDELKK